MADYEEEIPDEDKIKIASDFILNAPPGEFNEVFNDVRVLLANDALLKEGTADAFAKYNEQQFTPAKLEGTEEQVLITPFARQPNGRYLDPRSKQTFAFDHLRKTIRDLKPASSGPNESLRAAVEKAASDYVPEHYHTGTFSVYAVEGEVVLCIEDHKFQPRNFWNGRWRSEWHLKPSGEVVGTLRVQVHYYEDGNVQLQTVKEISSKVPKGDDAAMATKFFKTVLEAENEYQTAISENYMVMSDTTFKALRRALPVTRSKVDWNKIANYKVGKELAK